MIRGWQAACALTFALAFAPGALAGSALELQPNAVSCKIVRNASQLQAISTDLNASYCLTADIDLASIDNFTPIGDGIGAFNGNFFGNNHVIRNLRITNDTSPFVGLFAIAGGSIRDVHLVNINIHANGANATIGGLAGQVFSTAPEPTITNVSVSGQVRCGVMVSKCAGLVGFLTTDTLSHASSSADVAGGALVGGLVGSTQGVIQDSFATGNVACELPGCEIGGLVGLGQGDIIRSFATGRVQCGDNCEAGGLVGQASSNVSLSYASGDVIGGNLSLVGGLVGLLFQNSVDQCFSVGRLGAGNNSTVGGLIGQVAGGAAAFNSYWDRQTSATKTTAGGVSRSTAQLQAEVPGGFEGVVWAVTPKFSYPFIVGSPDFSAQLATLVRQSVVYVFLPIAQQEPSEYKVRPKHADRASLAAVYTMLARGVGRTVPQSNLANVRIDRPFWHDDTQTAVLSGPVTQQVKLGPLTALTGQISNGNVVGVFKQNKPVILRGTYTASGKSLTHWMLGTLFTTAGNGSPSSIVANDPWTGQQVQIDVVTKTVVWPADFPLKDFKVDGYQAVTIILPPA